MTQDTQAGAGAHPAPAQQPKTLRELAEVVRDWGKRDHAWAHPDPDCFDVALFGHISEDGEPYPVAEVNADTHGHEGVSLQLAQFYAAASPAAVLALLDRVELRDTELKAARADAKHWRSNHDNVVARLRIFTQRPDIPKELADRLPWYRELVRLQEVEAQAAAKCLDQGAEPAPVTYMATDNACKWAWDQVRKDVGTEGWTTSESCNFYGFFMWGWNYRGQYETQRPAAPPAPAAVAVPAVFGDEDHVLVPRALIGSACRAIDKKRDGTKTLAELRRYTVGDLSAVAPAQEHATQLAGQNVEVIEKLLRLAQIVERAVEDWGESFADGSCEVKFHKDEADEMEAILEFFDSLPDAPEDEGVIESGPLKAARAIQATAPTQAQEDARDTVRALIATHAEMLEDNAYAYFELAYTRQTGWMAWITDKPLYGAPVVNPDRKVLAKGQGDTPDEACADAARAAQGE